MKLIVGIDDLQLKDNGEISDTRYMTHDYLWYQGNIRLPDSNDGYLSDEEKQQARNDLISRDCNWSNIFYCDGHVCGIIIDQWNTKTHVLDIDGLEYSWSEAGLLYVFKEAGFYIKEEDLKVIIHDESLDGKNYDY